MVFNHTRAVFDVVDPIGGGKIIAITTYTVDALISLQLFKLIFPSFLRLVIPIFTETHQIFKSTVLRKRRIPSCLYPVVYNH